MRKASFRWQALLVVTLAMALAWGLRGEHGHERGAAIVGAMAGLALAAVTSGPRWVGAAVFGSLAFAVGGALSYGRFVELAFQGSWEAIGSLGLIGFAWGGLGCLGLGLGLNLSSYKHWERWAIGAVLLFVWFLVDRLLWGRLQGPEDMATRELMAVVLICAWVLLSAYVGLWRSDRVALRLGIAGGIGFGLGFPLAAWIQGVGPATGIPIDWWKVAEHTIGGLGGLALGLAVLTSRTHWNLPRAARPWGRWRSAVWLLWLLPSWLIANNLDFWVAERALLPLVTSQVVWSFLFLILLVVFGWSWMEIRQGRTFVTSWMPKQLTSLFLSFVWLVTVIGCSKGLVAGEWSPTPLGFLLLAVGITLGLRAGRSNAP